MTTYAPAPPATGVTFTQELFAALPRADQRRWASLYLRGLLTTPGKKSLRRIAATVGTSPTASQSMHQFINASPWDWEPVRDDLARWTARHLEPQAYVIDTVYIPKRGDHTCGVHTRFIPHLGRSMTCQVGLGLFLATGQEALPVDWRLHLPQRWLTGSDRLRTRIKGQDRPQSLDEQALDLVAAWEQRPEARPLPVVADLSAQGDSLRLLSGLARRGRPVVATIPPHLRLITAQGLESDAGAVTAGSEQSTAFTAGTSTAQVALSAPVRIAAAAPAGCYRVFVTRHGPHRTPRWWLTSLTDARVDRLMALAGLLDTSARAIADMQNRFGLADFEGRSFPGWHHHMTIMSAAYAWHRLHDTLPAPEMALL
ncbi:transposase (plasmid) [Streptomyces sp. NBC_01558]|uniref:IS701 family transposase n=1 Tax=Streptomyces sp. NBC_01558 TaxID=2975878 RepID=UPI002DD9B53D|nr:transposase [Streptomyces sp. NBC_01558]WSD82749.1 transposase [Streptomyces sp. NBC_01558]